jgi:hypothetical protein
MSNGKATGRDVHVVAGCEAGRPPVGVSLQHTRPRTDARSTIVTDFASTSPTGSVPACSAGSRGRPASCPEWGDQIRPMTGAPRPSANMTTARPNRAVQRPDRLRHGTTGRRSRSALWSPGHSDLTVEGRSHARPCRVWTRASCVSQRECRPGSAARGRQSRSALRRGWRPRP